MGGAIRKSGSPLGGYRNKGPEGVRIMPFPAKSQDEVPIRNSHSRRRSYGEIASAGSTFNKSRQAVASQAASERCKTVRPVLIVGNSRQSFAGSELSIALAMLPELESSEVM